MRELGEKIPVSIPTAIPLEEQITQIDANKKVDAVVMNLRTLWRNFHGAYHKETPRVLKDMVPLFIEETKQIVDIVQSDGIQAGIYLPNYAAIQGMKNGMIYKTEDKLTDNQKAERAYENAAVKLAAKELNAFSVNVMLPNIGQRCWMLTHTAIDLLNRYQFTDLKLLESHTGKLKGPSEWNTKITNNEDYMRIPFNILSLTVFGDRHYLQGYPLRYRKALKLLSERHHWTPMTTKQKIIQNLNDYKEDPAMAKEMIDMIGGRVS